MRAINRHMADNAAARSKRGARDSLLDRGLNRLTTFTVLLRSWGVTGVLVNRGLDSVSSGWAACRQGRHGYSGSFIPCTMAPFRGGCWRSPSFSKCVSSPLDSIRCLRKLHPYIKPHLIPKRIPNPRPKSRRQPRHASVHSVHDTRGPGVPQVCVLEEGRSLTILLTTFQL